MARTGRPLSGEAKMVKVSVMLDPDMARRIEALHARMQARAAVEKLPSTIVYREIVRRGVAQLEAEAPHEAAPRVRRPARKAVGDAA